MDLGISGRVAIITGGDSGMGYATAEYLLREDVKVVLTDIDEAKVQEAAKRLASLGDVRAVQADLTKAADVERLREAASTLFGQAPTILVAAAGITGATGDFLEISDEDWLHTLDADLMTAVRVTRAFIPAMREAGWGRIVLFASEDAVQPYVEELPYCASKAGIVSLTKGLSKAYGPEGVLVNVVSPAFVATPMTDKMMEKRAEENGTSFDEAIASFLDEKRPGMVLKRRGKPEEVAAAVAFLCSEQASFITGTNLRVDSGAVMTIPT
jgi:NAD(P)-dependent dehydrogenase (short-subunit alcohol dehydrogenase family)